MIAAHRIDVSTVARCGIQASENRGGRSGLLGMKPLNDAAGGIMKRCAVGASARLALSDAGSDAASAQAAQCLQGCGVGALSD